MVTSGCGPENERMVLTMAEYINREAAIRALLNDAPEQVSYSREDAADCIRYMDAADVAPVRHARWDENGRCSNCGGHAPFWCMASTYYKSPWCQECGAEMDLEG